MKNTFKFFGLLLLAGTLTFASCEKTDDETPANDSTQQDNNGGNNNDNNGGNNNGGDNGSNTPQQVQIDNGALPGVFSVSQSKTIRFSMGNLQYLASNNIWRFAEHQYDFIGADNTNASDSYTGYIDLFGWGTSGIILFPDQYTLPTGISLPTAYNTHSDYAAYSLTETQWKKYGSRWRRIPPCRWRTRTHPRLSRQPRWLLLVLHPLRQP